MRKEKRVKGIMIAFLSALCLLFHAFSFAQAPPTDSARMDWWRKARFGMFIHWGVYAVPAGRYHGKEVKGFYDGRTVPSAGEWIMHDAKIPVAEYQQFAKKFNPIRFDPDAWVKMAKAAGMKYIVITSKHHEGFAMFDSKASDWNIVKATPYGKDIIKQLADACRRQGMKLGLYYSQANDWNNPGGAAEGGHWDSAQNGSMDTYLQKVAMPQVQEILQNYGDIAELWWDVPTGMTKERAEQFLPLLKVQPGIITNNRLGGDIKGDIETPEQYIPGTGLNRDWETCMTMNDTWGFKLDDHHWKSSKKLIRNLIDIASKGGNYLLNVGPKANGEFPKPIIERLQAIGRWMKINNEAIYGTGASPFRKLEWGRCTQKLLDDGTHAMYLHVFEWPKNGILKLSALRTNPAAASLLATGAALKTKMTETGLEIDVPRSALDTMATVIKLVLKEKPVVEAYALTQLPGGRLLLTADDADLHNQPNTTEQITLEAEGDEKEHVGFWSDPKNWVSWKVKIDKPGRYTVRAIMGSPDDSGKISIRIGAEELIASKKNTGGYHHFKTYLLGKITVKEPGVYEVSIHPQEEQWKPFNLQEISLSLY